MGFADSIPETKGEDESNSETSNLDSQPQPTQSPASESIDYGTTPSLDLMKMAESDLKAREELERRSGGDNYSSTNLGIEGKTPIPNISNSERFNTFYLREYDMDKNPRPKFVGQRCAAISDSEHEVLATYGLGPCVGLVIYDTEKKNGFLAHLDGLTPILENQKPESVEMALKAFLRDKNNITTNLKTYLVGGETGASEGLLFNLTNLLGKYNVNIDAMDTLGYGESRSIVLDTRDGSLWRVANKDMKPGDFSLLTPLEMRTKGLELV